MFCVWAENGLWELFVHDPRLNFMEVSSPPLLVRETTAIEALEEAYFSGEGPMEVLICLSTTSTRAP